MTKLPTAENPARHESPPEETEYKRNGRLERIIDRIEDGNHERAEELVTDYLGEHPGGMARIEGLIVGCRLFTITGRFEEAVALLDEVAEISSGIPPDENEPLGKTAWQVLYCHRADPAVFRCRNSRGSESDLVSKRDIRKQEGQLIRLLRLSDG